MRFRDLGYTQKVMGRLDWVTPNGSVFDTSLEIPSPAVFEEVWVPTGFAGDVITAYAAGVRYLGRAIFKFESPSARLRRGLAPANRPFTFPMGILRWGNKHRWSDHLKKGEVIGVIGYAGENKALPVGDFNPKTPMFVSGGA